MATLLDMPGMTVGAFWLKPERHQNLVATAETTKETGRYCGRIEHGIL